MGFWKLKVDPVPSVLSTEMSPPIISQKRRLIARPRPVPPYLPRRRGIDLREVLEQPVDLLGGHADAGVAHAEVHPVPAVDAGARDVQANRARSG